MNATIAIPIADGQVYGHFGQASRFRVYTIADDRVTTTEEFTVNGGGHEELALELVMRSVNAVICGEIGPGAQGALMAAGVLALAGVEGDADAAVEQLIDGTLEALRNLANCSHHAHGGCGGHCGHEGGHCGHEGGHCGHEGGHCGHGGCCH